VPNHRIAFTDRVVAGLVATEREDTEGNRYLSAMIAVDGSGYSILFSAGSM